MRSIHTGLYSINIPEDFPQVKQLGHIVKAETLGLREGEQESAFISAAIGENKEQHAREEYLVKKLARFRNSSWATTLSSEQPLEIDGLTGVLYKLCSDAPNEHMPRMFYCVVCLFIDDRFVLEMRCECDYNLRNHYLPLFLLSIYSLKLTGGDAGAAAGQTEKLIETAMDEVFRNIQKKADAERAAREAARKEEQSLKAQLFQQLDDEQLLIQLRERIQQLGLHDFANELLATAKPCIYAHTIGPDDYSHKGSSRFGGAPDWPEGWQWPCDRHGFHLNFHAQINLAEIAHLQHELPARGMLYFFNGSEQAHHHVVCYEGPVEDLRRYPVPETVEDDQEAAAYYIDWDRNTWDLIVLEKPDAEITATRDESGRHHFFRNGKPVMLFSEIEDVTFRPYRVFFRKGYSFPGYGTPAYGQMALSKAGNDIIDRYFELENTYNNVSDKESYAHQLFGYPSFQGGETWEPAKRAAEAAQDPALKDPANWFLLLSIVSDAGHKVGFCFGDYGNSYYLANRKAIAEKRFDHVWGMVESS